MKSLSLKYLVVIGLWNWVVAIGVAQDVTPAKNISAVQAIQQAPDPSAAVAAYADGIAADRRDSAVHAAYVARMVDFGLPEMAYRQAQMLTTLDPKNGLAWAVVAHVDARRGNMEESLSSINLAGQSAPENKFVQRTAGEILAWYDTRADQSKVPDETKAGVARLREVLASRADFAAAYDTAKKAYQTQTTAPQPSAAPAPAPVVPQSQVLPSGVPEVYTDPYATGPAYVQAAPPPYYNDYYYDWGPGWIEPAPSWWWRPSGFFVGFDFFPFPSVFVFDHGRHFHHGHDRLDHDRFNHHRSDGQFFRGQRDRRIAQSGAVSSRNSGAFFGSAARPDPRLRNDQLESRFRTTPGLLSPGAAVPQRGSIGRPGTSSAAPAPPLAAPNPALRQRSTATPRTTSPATLPARTPATSMARSSPPLAVPNPAVRQGSVTPGRGTAIVPNSPATAPATRSLSSVTARPPGVRQGVIVPRTVPAPRMSAPAIRNAPSFAGRSAMPGAAMRSAPSFSAPRSFSAPGHVSSGSVHMGGTGSGGGFHVGGGRGGGGRR